MNKNYFLLLILFIIQIYSCKKSTTETPIHLQSFSPAEGIAGDTIQIIGSGFLNYAYYLHLFFNGTEAVITSLSDSLLKAVVPPNATSGKISCTLNVQHATSTNDFIIYQNTWLMKRAPVFTQRWNASGFSIGNKGFVGAGQDLNSSLPFTDWWEYDPTLDQWTSRTAIPFSNGLLYGVSFSINDKGYMGIGVAGQNSPLTKELWQYDTTANSWTRKADFPGKWKFGAISLTVGSKGYVGLGGNSDDSVGTNFSNGQDWWEYDPGTDQWTQKSDFPIPGETSPTGFVVNNKIYLGLGENTDPQYAQSWWEYDPAADQWTRKSDCPVSQDWYPPAFSIGNYGYIIGITGCLAYDPASDQWIKLPFFSDLRYNGVAFAIGGKGYITTGEGEPFPPPNDLWEFTPPFKMN